MTSIFAKAVTLVPLVVVAGDILSPNARSIDIEDSAFVETYEKSTQTQTSTTTATTTEMVTVVPTGTSAGGVNSTNNTLTGMNANGTYSVDQYNNWTNTSQNSNVTVAASMYTAILDYTHQFHLIQMEISRKREIYANYQSLQANSRAESLAKKNQLAQLSTVTYNQIVQHNRAITGLVYWYKYIQQMVYNVQAQFQAMFQKDPSWVVTASKMSVQRKLQVYQLKDQEKRRK